MPDPQTIEILANIVVLTGGLGAGVISVVRAGVWFFGRYALRSPVAPRQPAKSETPRAPSTIRCASPRDA